MSDDWTVPAWAVVSALGVLVLLGIVLLVALGRARGRAEALQSRVDAIERRLAEPPPASAVTPPPALPESEFVITHLGDRSGPEVEPVPTVAAPLFADLVLRESVVQAASLTAGLRRALSPQMRHKIRFEMRREVKRARKQRRSDLREARRAWEAQQRASEADAA